MASLLKEFKGRLDLIYIDPPFDVGARTFGKSTFTDENESEGLCEICLQSITPLANLQISGQFAAAFHADQSVLCPMEDQRWELYGMKNAGNIYLAIHGHQCNRGGGTCAEALEFALPFLNCAVVCFRWGEGRQTLAAAPCLVHVLQQRVPRLVSCDPVAKPRKRAIEHKGLGSLGMTGGE